MAGASKIEWTDCTWNPIAGCSVVSPGCTNCYAMKMAARVEAMAAAQGRSSPYDGLTIKTKAGAVWNGTMRLVEGVLTTPIHWRKPRKIFVNSMSDLFHPDVPDAWRDQVVAVMQLTPRHTYQILTKRPDEMRAYFERLDKDLEDRLWATGLYEFMNDVALPLPNVWLGISAEDQDRLEARILDLAMTPAAVRIVSAEPLFGELDFENVRIGPNRWLDAFAGVVMGRSGATDIVGYLDQVIVGGESGPNARPCWVPHVRKVVRQAQMVGAAVYVKQLGANVRDRNDAGFDGCEPHEWPSIDPARVEDDPDGYRDEGQGAPVRIRLVDRKGGDPAEWPEDLRIRQFPGMVHV